LETQAEKKKSLEEKEKRWKRWGSLGLGQNRDGDEHGKSGRRSGESLLFSNLQERLEEKRKERLEEKRKERKTRRRLENDE